MLCPFCNSTLPKTAESCIICGRSLPPEEATAATPSPSLPDAPSSLPAGESGLDEQVAAFASVPLEQHDTSEFQAMVDALMVERSNKEKAMQATMSPDRAISQPEYTTTDAVPAIVTGSEEAVEIDAADAPLEQETDLLSLVGLYAVIGGYSGAVVGLFVPGVVVLAYCLSSADLIEFFLEFILFFVLGAILWIPLSVIVAVVAGIGGLLLGLMVGAVAALLFRLTFDNPQALKVSRVLVAILNAVVFGFAASWAYSNSFIANTFSELVLVPHVLGVIGALAGLVMGLVGPEKVEEDEEITDEEFEEAAVFFLAPFRLWSSVAGRTGAASTAALASLSNQADSSSDLDNLGINKKRSASEQMLYDQQERIIERLAQDAKALTDKAMTDTSLSPSQRDKAMRAAASKEEEIGKRWKRMNDW